MEKKKRTKTFPLINILMVGNLITEGEIIMFKNVDLMVSYDDKYSLIKAWETAYDLLDHAFDGYFNDTEMDVDERCECLQTLAKNLASIREEIDKLYDDLEFDKKAKVVKD